MFRRPCRVGWLAILGLLSATGCERPTASRPVTIFAAASVAPALTTLLSDSDVRISAAASGQLARQIELGAPADLFVSADPTWVRHLQQRGRVASSQVLLGNQLVLIAPPETDAPADLKGIEQLGPIAIGDPEAVPAGRYAKAVLAQSGLWERVESELVHALDVRHVLLLVELGEVAGGFVYASDLVDAKVRVVQRFGREASGPIEIHLAILAGADRPPVSELAEKLQAAAARGEFAAFGFTNETSAAGKAPFQLPSSD